MNVLLITTDQHKATTIGAYGDPLGATPNLDRRAAGVRRHDLGRELPQVCEAG